MNRLFFAVPVTEAVRTAIDTHLRTALPQGLPGRPTPPRNWHLTLRFIGDASELQQSRLSARLASEPAWARFTLSFGGFGAFPRAARATVLWFGVTEGAEALRILASGIEEAAVHAGFPPEARGFSPHLTLSRSRAPIDVRPIIAGIPDLHVEMPVEEFVLYRSLLGSGPPRYVPVERFPLS